MLNYNSFGTPGEDIDADDDPSTENELNAVSKKDIPVKKVRPSAGKKRKRAKYKRKDYPKKALSAYNIFFKETREKIITERGKTNFQEMVRMIVALWKEITPEDKLKFDSIASRDLIRFKEEVNEYEWSIVEKSRKKLSTSEESKKETTIIPLLQISAIDPTSVGVDAKTHRRNDDDETQIIFPVRNVKISNISHGGLVTRKGQGLVDDSSSTILTSNELQLAQHRLKKELNATGERQSIRQIDVSLPNMKGGSLSADIRSTNGMCLERDLVESKLTPTEMQFYRRNLLEMGFVAGDHTVASGEPNIENRESFNLHNFGGNSRINKYGLEIKRRIARASLGDDTRVASNDVELRKRLGLAGDTLATSNEIERRNRLVGLSENPAAVSYELKLREKFGLGADTMAAFNQTRLKKHLKNTGKNPMINRNFIRESETQFGCSNIFGNGSKITNFGGLDENGIRPRFGLGIDSTRAFEKMEIQKHLSLGNQMMRSNEAQIRNLLILNELNRSSKKASNEAETLKRFLPGGDPMVTSTEAEIRKYMSMDGVQNRFTEPNAEMQKRLAMIQGQELMPIQLGLSSQIMGLGSCYEGSHFREERIRQQKRATNHLSGSVPSSLQGGFPRAELSELRDMRRRRLPGGLIVPSDSVTSQSLDNADIQSALMKSQLLLGMGRR